MVNQLPNYNAAFVYDAMKYLQHTAVVEHKDSLSDDIKSSLSSAPLIALPTALSTKSMLQEMLQRVQKIFFKKLQVFQVQ